MSGNHSSGPMIPAGPLTIAQATTVVHGTGFTSRDLPVWDVEMVVLQGQITGEAAANGDVDFIFVGSVDGINFDTIGIKTLTLTMIGATPVNESVQLDVTGYKKIRLLSIQNKDAAKDATVQVVWGKGYGA